MTNEAITEVLAPPWHRHQSCHWTLQLHCSTRNSSYKPEDRLMMLVHSFACSFYLSQARRNIRKCIWRRVAFFIFLSCAFETLYMLAICVDKREQVFLRLIFSAVSQQPPVHICCAMSLLAHNDLILFAASLRTEVAYNNYGRWRQQAKGSLK